MNHCLFCNIESLKYSKDIDFVCSQCILLLSELNRETLIQGLQIAKEKNLPRKIQALEMFIEPAEKQNVKPRRKKRSKRNYDRARSSRPNRFKKRSAI